MGQFQDLTGQIFHKITILKITNKRTKDKRILWICQCECGKKLLRTAKDLKTGHTKSCGCYRDYIVKKKNPNTRHKLRYHPLYKKLMDMKARCYNPKNKRYDLYGQKGIKICQLWLKPKNFIEWAINHNWKEGLTIDRIDSNKDYCPENCQWLSKSEHSIKTNKTRSGKEYAPSK